MSIIPPASFARLLYFVPTVLPSFTPNADKRKVITPIEIAAGIIGNPGIRAKETPEAKASMLVAVDKSSISVKLVSSEQTSSFEKESFIMPKPMRISRAKEIIPEKQLMLASKKPVKKYPDNGINA